MKELFIVVAFLTGLLFGMAFSDHFWIEQVKSFDATHECTTKVTK